MQHSYKKIILSFAVLIFFHSTTYASGSYLPLGAPNSKSQYTEGKIIYHKLKSNQAFNSCVSCYTDQGSLSNACAALKQCVTANFNMAQLPALEYFLKKRYRLE